MKLFETVSDLAKNEVKLVTDEKELLTEVSCAREDFQLIRLQLLQVQDELQYYFLESNKLKAERDELGRKKRAERERKEELALQLDEMAKQIKSMRHECRSKDKKLALLRAQRQILVKLVKFQSNVYQRFSALGLRSGLLRISVRMPYLLGITDLQTLFPSKVDQGPQSATGLN